MSTTTRHRPRPKPLARAARLAAAVFTTVALAAACTEDLPDATPAADAFDAQADVGDPETRDSQVRPDAGRPDASPMPDAYVCVSKGQELCGNGEDDDCDGEFDEVPEGVGEVCREGLGICAREGIVTCNDAEGLYACSVSAGPPAEAELCNDLDDDCDGLTDEGLGVGDACTLAFPGGCEVSGTQVCGLAGGGLVLICSAPDADPDGDGFACEADCAPNDGAVNPLATETCNLVDDDCDGVVDEGLDCPCEPRPRGDRTYLFCAGETTQAAATSVCGAYNQVVLEVGHASEQSFVTRQTTSFDARLSWWLALRAPVPDGAYEWASGAPLTFTAWFGGGNDPLVRLPGQDCAEMFGGATWGAVDCLSRNAVVCEPDCVAGTDFDGDGFEACSGDCDDRDPRVAPGRSETCGDDIDNNCDGRVDEGC